VAVKDSEYVAVFITTADDEEAQLISQALLEQKKVACANIIAGVSSQFWWQDKIDTENESLLIVKTTASLLNKVVTLVQEAHSYDNPEIIALPIVGGSQDYLEWIGRVVDEAEYD
jgi:periplasmic divalent cation tolerance protein